MCDIKHQIRFVVIDQSNEISLPRVSNFTQIESVNITCFQLQPNER